jgi:hypothetical protein
MLSQDKFLTEILWRYCKSIRNSPFSQNGRLGNECLTIWMMFRTPCGEKRIAYWEFHFDGTNLYAAIIESEGN